MALVQDPFTNYMCQGPVCHPSFLESIWTFKDGVKPMDSVIHFLVHKRGTPLGDGWKQTLDGTLMCPRCQKEIERRYPKRVESLYRQ